MMTVISKYMQCKLDRFCVTVKFSLKHLGEMLRTSKFSENFETLLFAQAIEIYLQGKKSSKLPI